MKKNNFLYVIIAILIVAVLSLGIAYWNKSRHLNAATAISMESIAAFYNAKDATNCMLDYALQKVDYSVCDHIITQVSEDYAKYNSSLDGDLSEYK